MFAAVSPISWGGPVGPSILAPIIHASKPDPHPDGDRWHTIGLVGSVLLLVIHTWPEETETETEPVGRIISARKATAHERKAYEGGNF